MRVDVMSLEDVKAGLADHAIHLVDVREPHEYAAGHIPGAVNMPLSAFDPQALPKDKPVVLSCQSGRRTLLGLQQAQEAGREDVHTHFQGSLNAWLQAGEPVER
ncbi:MAG: Rhodanese domain protein [Hyphomicrobiales bacterium]|jgi:rhodanese-related sulfurtransferase|nr:Rhodanese domain protein [Hyphomicrobiales bacterium]